MEGMSSNNVNCSTYVSVFLNLTPPQPAPPLPSQTQSPPLPLQTAEILVSKLCFVLSALATLCHVMFVTTFREIRQHYGLRQLLAMYTNLLANICLLVVLCMPLSVNSMFRLFFNTATHYNFLCSVLWNVVEAFLMLHALRHASHRAPIIQIHTWRKFIKCLVLVTTCPMLLVAPPLFLELFGPVQDKFFRNLLRPFDTCYSGISCCLTDQPAYLFLLSLPLLLLIGITAAFLGVYTWMARGASEERLYVAKNRVNQTRFGLLCKVTSSGAIVWVFGVLATGMSSLNPHEASFLWNIFSIFYALQAIFVSITCIFSRPVLEVIQKKIANKDLKLDTGFGLLAKAMTTRNSTINGRANNRKRLRPLV